MKTTKTLIAAAIIAASLGACTNTKVANNESLAIAAQKEAQQVQLTPAQAIKQSQEKIAKAKDDGLRFYAPLHLEKAENQLQDAQEFADKEASPENQAAAIAAALTANKLVESGYKNKATVEKELATPMQHIEILRKLGTDKAMPKDFNKATSSLNDLIRETEGQNMDKMAKGRSKLTAYMNELEAETLKQQYLNKAELMLDKATDADADDLAEQSYQDARKAIKRAGNFIDDNFRDREGVQKVSDEAFQAASKAYYVALEVEKIYEADREKLEQFVLSLHKHLAKVNRTVGVENLSSYSLREQANMIHAALDKHPSVIKTAEPKEDAKVPATAETAMKQDPATEPETDNASAEQATKAQQTTEVSAEQTVDQLKAPAQEAEPAAEKNKAS